MEPPVSTYKFVNEVLENKGNPLRDRSRSKESQNPFREPFCPQTPDDKYNRARALIDKARQTQSMYFKEKQEFSRMKEDTLDFNNRRTMPMEPVSMRTDEPEIVNDRKSMIQSNIERDQDIEARNRSQSPYG